MTLPSMAALAVYLRELDTALRDLQRELGLEQVRCLVPDADVVRVRARDVHLPGPKTTVFGR